MSTKKWRPNVWPCSLCCATDHVFVSHRAFQPPREEARYRWQCQYADSISEQIGAMLPDQVQRPHSGEKRVPCAFEALQVLFDLAEAAGNCVYGQGQHLGFGTRTHIYSACLQVGQVAAEQEDDLYGDKYKKIQVVLKVLEQSHEDITSVSARHTASDPAKASSSNSKSIFFLVCFRLFLRWRVWWARCLTIT